LGDKRWEVWNEWKVEVSEVWSALGQATKVNVTSRTVRRERGSNA